LFSISKLDKKSANKNCSLQIKRFFVKSQKKIQGEIFSPQENNVEGPRMKLKLTVLSFI
jgi:hypothetical protein